MKLRSRGCLGNETRFGVTKVWGGEEVGEEIGAGGRGWGGDRLGKEIGGVGGCVGGGRS